MRKFKRTNKKEGFYKEWNKSGLSQWRLAIMDLFAFELMILSFGIYKNDHNIVFLIAGILSAILSISWCEKFYFNVLYIMSEKGYFTMEDNKNVKQ